MTYKNVTFKPIKSMALEARIAKILSDLKHTGQVIFYEELGQRLGMLPRHRSIARALGNLVWEDVRNGRPIRSSLVVRKDSHVPGTGYFDVLSELGFDVPASYGERQIFILDRQTEVFSN